MNQTSTPAVSIPINGGNIKQMLLRLPISSWKKAIIPRRSISLINKQLAVIVFALRTCEKHNEHMEQMDDEVEQQMSRLESRIRQEVGSECWKTVN